MYKTRDAVLRLAFSRIIWAEDVGGRHENAMVFSLLSEFDCERLTNRKVNAVIIITEKEDSGIHNTEEQLLSGFERESAAAGNKEKEEDFMLMKGCKLPQRPKKRAKTIQKTILLVTPGAWLSDLCQERYEVREKKTAKKRPRGLKAMGTMESDSE
ncbi:pumilio homolog 12 [Tanacetum coccineum]